MEDTARTENSSESDDSASDAYPRRDVLIRNVGNDTYQLLRRLAFERDEPYGVVIADALRCLETKS